MEHQAADLARLLGLPDKTFNKLYRERRLAAQVGRRPFPVYNQAREQLEQAVNLARVHGGIDDINAFWDYVFRASGKLCDDNSGIRPPGRKAAARRRTQSALVRS